MVETPGVLQVLVELLEVPLGGAVAEALGRGALGADRGAPDQIEGADALGGGDVWSADAGFEGVNVWASAFLCDAEQRGQGAYRAKASGVLLGNEGNRDSSGLCG